MSGGGYIKLLRPTGGESDDITAYLLRRPNALALLTQIALRARWSRPGIDPRTGISMELGEALIGDYATIGLTEQQYRTAKKDLIKTSQATFTATNKGTKAKLLKSSVYDINMAVANDQNNSYATNDQQVSNGQPTTNKECKNNEKNDNNDNAAGGRNPLARLRESPGLSEHVTQELIDLIEMTIDTNGDDYVDANIRHTIANLKNQSSLYNYLRKALQGNYAEFSTVTVEKQRSDDSELLNTIFPIDDQRLACRIARKYFEQTGKLLMRQHSQINDIDEQLRAHIAGEFELAIEDVANIVALIQELDRKRASCQSVHEVVVHAAEEYMHKRAHS